jgi:hypothetical protein
MRMSNRSIKVFQGLVFGVALALAGCVQVQADIPDVEVTQHGILFDGVPFGSMLGEVSTTRTFTLSGDTLSFAKDLNSEVYAMEVSLTPIAPLQDLSFIHSARVTMSSSTGTTALTPAEIINYEREGAPVSTAELTVQTLYPVDVTDLWAADKTVITLTISGVLPETAWGADLTLRLGGKIEYKM